MYHIRLLSCLVLWTIAPIVASGAETRLVPGAEASASPPGFSGALKVYTPVNYDAGEPWPAIVFYHGTGSEPNTTLFHNLTGGRDYFVIGMPYLRRDAAELPKAEYEAYVAREIGNFRVALAWLNSQVKIDAQRVFMAGVSKGGWYTSMLGERELSRLGGLVLLLAGRPQRGTSAAVATALRGKAVYVGVGESDPNFLTAIKAREFYRRNGAAVTFEEFRGYGHEVPPGPSRLKAWLEAQGKYRQASTRDATKQALGPELKSRFAAAAKLANPVRKYDALVELAADPKLSLFSERSTASIHAAVEALRRQPPFRQEWAAEKGFSDILWRELNTRSLADMKAVRDGLQKLSEAYPETRYGGLAADYHPRVAEAYEKSVQATRAARERMEAARPRQPDAVQPTFPTVGGERSRYPVMKRDGNRISFE